MGFLAKLLLIMLTPPAVVIGTILAGKILWWYVKYQFKQLDNMLLGDDHK